MSELFADSITWAVIFCPAKSDDPHWTARLLHRDFAHCYLIRECGDGALVIDPLGWGIATRFEDKPFNDVVLHHAQDATACLLYVADYRFNTYAIGRAFYSCVSVVKAALGLRSGRLVQTPKALYKYLLTRRGASLIRPWSPWTGGKHERAILKT